MVGMSYLILFSFWRPMMDNYLTPDDGKEAGENDGLKAILGLITIVLFVVMLSGVLSGCGVQASARGYYPDDWKRGGDPAESRLAVQGIDLDRPPVPSFEEGK